MENEKKRKNIEIPTPLFPSFLLLNERVAISKNGAFWSVWKLWLMHCILTGPDLVLTRCIVIYITTYLFDSNRQFLDCAYFHLFIHSWFLIRCCRSLIHFPKWWDWCFVGNLFSSSLWGGSLVCYIARGLSPTLSVGLGCSRA